MFSCIRTCWIDPSPRNWWRSPSAPLCVPHVPSKPMPDSCRGHLWPGSFPVEPCVLGSRGMCCQGSSIRVSERCPSACVHVYFGVVLTYSTPATRAYSFVGWYQVILRGTVKISATSLPVLRWVCTLLSRGEFLWFGWPRCKKYGHSLPVWMEAMFSPLSWIYLCINFKIFVWACIRLLCLLEMIRVGPQKMARLGKFSSPETTVEPAAVAQVYNPSMPLGRWKERQSIINSPS